MLRYVLVILNYTKRDLKIKLSNKQKPNQTLSILAKK